jgi:hypothetical protein
MEIHHLCKNKSCANPDHLQAITKTEHNLLEPRLPNDPWFRSRKKKAFCKWGHPFSGDNVYKSPGGNRQCITCNKIREKKRMR